MSGTQNKNRSENKHWTAIWFRYTFFLHFINNSGCHAGDGNGKSKTRIVCIFMLWVVADYKCNLFEWNRL